MRQVFALCLASLLLAGAAPIRAAEPAPAPIPAAAAAAKMSLPAGFKSTLFAGEPDVVQPISFCFDDRGRLWVVEGLAYPTWIEPGQPGTDRISIFEDQDGDGKFDKKTVFLENGLNYAGIELGFGGVWVAATPYLLFIPDANGDDKPDGPPVVVLDGWDIKAKHNVFNNLSWGPDGWLWGCNGILSNSLVGQPGTPSEQRTPINCGVWRLHPTTKKFEVVAHGTTNPWGLDFDDYGHAFITNCVIHHLWHVVPGAHFQRMFGQDMMPNSYELLPSCADYLHWAGGPWQSSRDGEEHRRAGGGHAHAGAMIYLGDNWPAKYRNSLFTCNIHGNRVNEDRLRQVGSAYDAERADDFLFANDPWHRGLELAYGPDGGVYLTDWCDTDECHDYVDIHRENGRIFKVTYGDVKPWQGDLQKLSNADLVKLQTHANDWFVRHARRILQERAAGVVPGAEPITGVRQALVDLLNGKSGGPAERLAERDSRHLLRALWALHAINAADESLLLSCLDSTDAHVREWAVRLGSDDQPSPALLKKFVALAANDPSAAVRLALASTLQRVPLDARASLALALVAHPEDATDRTLPLMLWYGIEPLISTSHIDVGALLDRTASPTVLRLIARRIGSHKEGDANLTLPNQTRAAFLQWLGQDHPTPAVRAALTGLRQAYEGVAEPKMPAAPQSNLLWTDVASKLTASSDPEVRNSATILALWFGDKKAGEVLAKVVVDKTKPAAEREQALAALAAGTAPEFKKLQAAGNAQSDEQKAKAAEAQDLSPMLYSLLDEPELRVAALRRIPSFGNPKSGEEILRRYAGFSLSEKQEALAALASRPQWAQDLLAAIEKEAVPQRDVSAYTVRQLQALKNAEIETKLKSLWGSLRPPAEGKAQLLTEYKTWLTAPAIMKADARKGRVVFTKTCAGCHKLFDAGGDVGPNLTGSQRANIDYLLENLLDPSAVVAREYQTNVIETHDGRTIVGVVDKETNDALMLKTPGGLVIVPKPDVADRQQSPLSLMPENMLSIMPREDLLDLAAYLASEEQVTAAEAAQNGASK